MRTSFNARAIRPPVGAALLLALGAGVGISLLLASYTSVPDQPKPVAMKMRSAAVIPTVRVTPGSTESGIPLSVREPLKMPEVPAASLSAPQRSYEGWIEEPPGVVKVSTRPESDPGLGASYMLRIFNPRTAASSMVGPYTSFDACEATRVSIDHAGSFPTQCVPAQ